MPVHTLSLEDLRATAARPTFLHRYAGEGAGSLRPCPKHWHSAVLTHPPGQDCGSGSSAAADHSPRDGHANNLYASRCLSQQFHPQIRGRTSHPTIRFRAACVP